VRSSVFRQRCFYSWPSGDYRKINRRRCCYWARHWPSAACTATDAGRAAVEKLLDAFPRGRELLGLDGVLAGCRVRKDGARIRSC
jgi:hypothetical protein